MRNKSLIIVPASLVTITALVGLILSSTLAYAVIHGDSNSSVIDELDITVHSACTMKGGSNGIDDSGNSTYTATINAGNYTELSGSKLVTLCNDKAGYSIYAIGFSGDSYDSETHTDLIGTETTGNIQTGTSGDDSYWAMKLEVAPGLTPPAIETAFQSYHVIPDTYTKVASYNSSTTTASDEGATVQTKYKINISKTQLAGVYSGKVKYVMVHPNAAPAPTPPTAVETCDTPVPNLTYMQDLNSSNKASVLASMTEDEQYFLKDRRDEKSYCVARLKDGNIWMTQNLDLNLDSTKTYTPADTDISANWTPAKSTYSTGDLTWSYSENTPESYDPGDLYMNRDINYEEGLNKAQMYAGTCMSGSCDQSLYEQLPNDWRAFIDTCDATFEQCDYSIMPQPPADSYSTIGNQYYHIGNYYNWTAAVAMNDSSSYSTQYQDADQSICPANWMLPKGGNITTSGSFQYLVTQYGWDSNIEGMTSTLIQDTPINPVFCDFWSGSSEGLTYDGDGYYWSSVVKGSDMSYELYANTDNTISPNSSSGRYAGTPIRCVSRSF